MNNLAELGQEYGNIVLRQETGKDLWGDKVKKFQPNDAQRMNEIEKAFRLANNYTLNQYIENCFEIQEENI